jgi:hypothetical protein
MEKLTITLTGILSLEEDSNGIAFKTLPHAVLDSLETAIQERLAIEGVENYYGVAKITVTVDQIP